VLMAEHLTEDQTGLADQGIDTLGEVSDLTIGFALTRYAKSGASISKRKVYPLSTGVEYQPIDPSDPTVIDQKTLSHSGGRAYLLSEWAEDDAQRFREALGAGCSDLATQVLENELNQS